MTRENDYFIVYDQENSGGEICEGDEGSDWPNYETEYRAITPQHVTKGTPRGRYYSEQLAVHGLPADAKEVFVPVIRYSDGDTFSSSSGNTYFVGGYGTREAANIALKAALSESPKAKPNQYKYKPWEGYFNRLEETEVVKLEIMYM